MRPDFGPHETGFGGDCPTRIKINRKGDSMKGQIPAFVFAVCIASLVPTVVPTAQAKAPIRECSASPGKTQGHWSWRLIDGRKCWYAGKTMISKSLLQWPAKASVQAKADPSPAPVTVAAEKRSDPLDAQAQLLEYANSFEARWRARAITD
jgi:hypothetical protein